MKNLTRSIFVLILSMAPLVTSSLSMAQEPGGDRMGERQWRRPDGGGGEYRYRRMRIEPPTEFEWNELTTFMKENSPKRWEIFESLPENTPVRDRARNLLLQRYRMLVKTKGEDEQIYNVLLDRVKLEDKIFGIVTDLKKQQAENPNAADSESLRSDFRAKTSDLIDLGIKERKLRIERLQKSLESEREKLASDEKNRDGLIDERMRRFESGEFNPNPPRTQAPTVDPNDANAGINVANDDRKPVQ